MELKMKNFTYLTVDIECINKKIRLKHEPAFSSNNILVDSEIGMFGFNI